MYEKYLDWKVYHPVEDKEYTFVIIIDKENNLYWVDDTLGDFIINKDTLDTFIHTFIDFAVPRDESGRLDYRKDDLAGQKAEILKDIKNIINEN